jgi:hypothetical protein
VPSNEASNCYRAVDAKSRDIEKICTLPATKGDIESIWYLGDELQKNGNIRRLHIGF